MRWSLRLSPSAAVALRRRILYNQQQSSRVRQFTTTTSSNSNHMDQPAIPAVDLMWKTVNDKTTVSLQERSATLIDEDHHVNHEPQQQSSSDSDTPAATSIPESVLVYERQHRKAQHAKKAGRILDPSELKVVYVDDCMVVVDKPPGVLTVPGVHHRFSLANLVHAAYGSSTDDPATLIVHRLDMDTSGLVVFGRTPEAASKLQAAFRDRQVEKEYECLVMGHFPDFNGKILTIDLPLQKDHEHPPFMRVATPRSEHAARRAVHDLQQHGWKKLVAKKAKPSQTVVARVLERGYWNSNDDDRLPFTRLRLVPLTGRTHQLRVHCAALGFPMIGDPTYSLYGEAAPVGGLGTVPMLEQPQDSNSSTMEPEIHVPRCSMQVQKAWTAHHPPNEQPMCLHAALLALPHPVTGEPMEWEVPPNF